MAFKQIHDFGKQVDEFMDETGTTIDIKFLKHDKYFFDDEYEVDIYAVTLKNHRHSYKFSFAQSLVKNNIIPVAYDILAAMQSFPPGTLEDFAKESGYDLTTVRGKLRGRKVYKLVMQEWENLNLLYTPEQIKKLSYIR